VIIQGIRKVIGHRELIANLVIRDLKTKYRNSFLGYLWTLLDPLLMMVVYVVIFSIIIRIKVENYPVFLLAGILPWTFFAGTLGKSMTSLRDNADLMMKIYFPRELFPISITLTELLNFALSLFALIPFLIFYKIAPSFRMFAIPGLIIIQFMFVLGLSFILSILTAYAKDVANIMTVAIRMWFYVTPIIYPPSMVPERFRFALLINPMASITEMYRWSILGLGEFNPSALAIAAAFSVGFFLVGWWFFRLNESDIIKRL